MSEVSFDFVKLNHLHEPYRITLYGFNRDPTKCLEFKVQNYVDFVEFSKWITLNFFPFKDFLNLFKRNITIIES